MDKIIAKPTLVENGYLLKEPFYIICCRKILNLFMLPDYPHKVFDDKRDHFELLMETLAMQAGLAR